eukprot:SAG11_NODE_7061_length_1200_cov_4.208901_1_plen_50_part_01
MFFHDRQSALLVGSIFSTRYYTRLVYPLHFFGRTRAMVAITPAPDRDTWP